MSDEIIKVLDALSEKFGLAFDWTSENVFPYLEQLSRKLVNYEIATSVFWLCLGVMLFVAGGLLMKFDIKEGLIAAKLTSDDCGFLFLVASALLALGIAVSITQSLDIITCLTFPEKIILEELKSLTTSLPSK